MNQILSAEVARVAPRARKEPKVDVYHRDRRTDDYFWLRNKKDPTVAAYLEAENAYADAILKPTAALQEALYKEMLSHIKETDLSVPYKDGGFYYYSRTEEGKQYPIYCRKKGSLEAPEQVTLDLNELARGEKFMALGAYAVSDDGRYLAYSTDTTGFRDYTLVVKNLETGELLAERMKNTSSVAWANDNKTLFYAVEDEAKRPFRVLRHTLGSTVDDVAVYEDKDELFRAFVGKSRSKAFLFVGSTSHTTSEWRMLRADEPAASPKLLAPRQQDHEYDVDHRGDFFYIRTNDRGRNFRIVKAPVADPRRENWQETVAHSPDVMIEGIDCFADHYVLMEREGGLPQFRITSFVTGASRRVAFPEPAYSAFPAANPEWRSEKFRYSYQSLVTPASVYNYDVATGESTLLKRTEIPGGFDASAYQSERLFATAADGTKVPISVVYRKDVRRDGAAPMHLVGYGSYGFPLPVTFSSNRLALLDRGFVFALAHIRGGGEMGKAWHDAGRMMQKKNTFTDFIAVAEHLLAQRYTSRERLVIEGGSAGGLLMGAVTNMRPDLFRAVVSKVPFVDVLNTMMDASLPLTAGEWEEWGDPRTKEHYDYIKTYCPYTNLTAKAYPRMLVKTSFNDSQVMYWEPAKYVAKLRTLKTDDNVLLLKTNMNAGHGGASGRYDYLREVALDYAFILTQVGVAR